MNKALQETRDAALQLKKNEGKSRRNNIMLSVYKACCCEHQCLKPALWWLSFLTWHMFRLRENLLQH